MNIGLWSADTVGSTMRRARATPPVHARAMSRSMTRCFSLPETTMPRTSLPLSALALAFTLAGCRSAGQSATSAGAIQTVAPSSRHELDFRGDFKGPLGVQLYSVRNPIAKDVPGTLARVRALGFREVELAGTYGLSAPQFRAELDRAGLRATSMHVGYERLRDSLSVVLDDARTL